MKLKNLFGMAAMAALVLSGCSNDEAVENFSQENAIEFGTYVDRDAQSRVAVTDLKELANDGFGVYANYTVKGTGVLPNFMNNQKVTATVVANQADGRDKYEWTYTPVKYWPNNSGEKVTFWAYSPYTEFENVKDFTAPIFRVEDGTDYVAAGPVEQGKQGVNEKVLFKFGHVMSKIGFKVEAVIDELQHEEDNNGDADTDTSVKDFNSEETTIVVTEVTLSGNLVTSGTMTWDATKNDWILSCDAATAKSHTLNSQDFADTDEYVYEKKDQTESKLPGQAATVDPKVLNDEDKYLMLVPQTADFNIKVKYSVITEDSNLATGYSCVENEIDADVEDFEFEENHQYNFVLHLGLTSVKFEAQVSGWETTPTDHYVNVPLNINK